ACLVAPPTRPGPQRGAIGMARDPGIGASRTGLGLRNSLFTIGAALAVAVAALWAVFAFVHPRPQGKIVIATGGSFGAFHEIAARYRTDLARYGIDLELRPQVPGT